MSEFENNVSSEMGQGLPDSTPNQQNVEENNGVPENQTQQEPQQQEPNYEERIKTAVEQANTPFKGAYELVNQIAANYGMSVEQYLQAVEQQKEQQQQQEPQYQEDQYNSYNNELVDWVRQQKAQQQFEMQKAQQEQAWISEVKDLMTDYPELKPENIPDQVYKDRIENNIPLVYAYARYQKNQDRQSIEQNTINNINRNNMATPGSLNNPGVNMQPNYNNMNTDDFNKLVEKVKSGEFR